MIKTPILKDHLDTLYGSTFQQRLDRWEFCRDRLNDYFVIPKKATHIQLVAHRHPAKGRLKVEFTSQRCRFVELDSENPQWTICYILHSSSERIAKLTKGELVWYVELYYWED